ncbi:MAG: accessory gene regulator B family protein [Clostridia bacterium]|nr:accessory gene regulator B family protein [Clostridia bacterium]
MKKMINGTIRILSKNNPEIEMHRATYAYGLDVFFSSFFNLLGILFVHALFGNLGAIAVVIVFFALLRTFAGGYHAQSRWRCFLFFLLLSMGAMRLFEYVMSAVPIFDFIIGVVPCFGLIAIFAPLDTGAKPLNSEKKAKYKKESLLVAVILSGVVLTWYYLSLFELSVLGALGIYMAVLTMLIRLIQKELRGDLFYESKVI